jgi:hypothetical protein
VYRVGRLVERTEGEGCTVQNMDSWNS